MVDMSLSHKLPGTHEHKQKDGQWLYDHSCTSHYLLNLQLYYCSQTEHNRARTKVEKLERR